MHEDCNKIDVQELIFHSVYYGIKEEVLDYNKKIWDDYVVVI